MNQSDFSLGAGAPKTTSIPPEEMAAENTAREARYHLFIRLASVMAKSLSLVPDVGRVELFGPLTGPLEPQKDGLFKPYDRLPLAVWVADLTCLERLRQEREQTLERFRQTDGSAVDPILVDLHIVPPPRGSTTWTRRLDRPERKVELKRAGYGGQRVRVLYDGQKDGVPGQA
jgi:hypothetical protein